ncbi:helix-turn-helix domain-containing protein [Bacillus sp. ISL-51]|uniref:CdaR family transcriptional regulator n=1 Tax=unclassified Bacillus (in: firmicutes) TaxID=185979 RepID=UPI001BE892F5|nr:MULTISPECIES: sugar diacid recognition domain-containing protein [unclassified Bacillus (in: firmicutes)]MBT2574169.1 helix-turn-helix domain-containing protein [Bacillus sp. ISL-51]MBT2632988.1 helix-turn-helix domain-containing protein [Bacillus sp. ISL-26]
MLLQPELAKKMIAEVKHMYSREVIITDTEGMIIAGTNETRIGRFHEGALICAREKRNVIITKEDEKQLEGVKSGLNLPVFSGHEVIAVFGLTGKPDEILPFGELLRKMTELFIKEARHMEQAQWQARMLESFMVDWLQLKEWSPGFLEKAKLLGADLSSHRQIILIQGAYHQHEAEQMGRLWQNECPSDLFVRWGNERILINHKTGSGSKEQLIRRIRAIFTKPVMAGIGRTVPGPRLPESYEQAEKALTVGIAKQQAVYEEDLKLDMCLADIKTGTRTEFSQRVFQNALEHEELLDTLRALFSRNLSLKRTAADMHIHINTLRYRLSKLETLTKMKLDHPEDITAFYLALRFLDQDTK